MGVLLTHPLVRPADVATSGQLTRDVAREAGLATEQSKLATVVTVLARRCLALAGAGEVTFSVDGDGDMSRLVIGVCDAGPGASPKGGAATSPATGDRAEFGLGLHSLRRLVNELEQTLQPGGGTRVTVAVPLPPDAAHDPGLLLRLAALRPDLAPLTIRSPYGRPADSAGAPEAAANVLALTRAELERVTAERDAVNAELALTNRGVLDLVAELSTANESLTSTGTRYRQLADQQSALADLGHRAVASHDITMLSTGLVGILRSVLEVQSVAVLRFTTGTPTLQIVAGDGYDPGLPARIGVSRRQVHKLQQETTSVIDLRDGTIDFSLPVPPGARSCAVVAVHTPAGPWGVLVTCDRASERYTATTTAFLEAAASLLAFSIARMASEEVTQHAALHDGLTGLPNRAQLLEHMGHALDDLPQPAGELVAEPSKVVIFLDIDAFKQVNDTAGHAAGDQVLKVAAARLRAVMRPDDVLARLGGDEFVALCEGGSEAAEAISRRLLSAFDEPFVIEGREVFLSASAGLALVGAGVTADQVLADADIAMYQAKMTPGSATAVFTPQMRSLADTESHLYSELRRALGRGQLRAVYQPVVDLSNGTVTGVETLLRWRHPDLGDVPAQQTVAAAERIGLAWELTCWIATEAARTISTWNVANPTHPPLRLAVNFTPLLLGDPGRVGELEALVTAAGLPFSLLDVELTETAFVDPTPDALALLADLRHRGARLSMDDFGTGYSSLMTVANLPLDVLKIDRSFVTPLHIGGDTLLVAAMTGIALGRGLETIGEGIETTTQLAALIAAECDLGQGYLFAKPLEKDQLESLTTLEPGFADTIRAARPALVADSATDHSTATHARQRAQILILEQNTDDLELLQSILKGTGHQITGLSDPAAFDEAVRFTQPDLILMGLRFRGTSGFDLVEHAKAPLTMPVVAVTGLPDWALHNEPRSHHFAAIIHKPVHPEELLTQTHELLANHRSRREDPDWRQPPQGAGVPAISSDRTMSPAADLKDVVEPYLEVAIRGDAASAVRLTLDLVDQGASVESIVDLLAAAQYECGQRWQRHDWGVADEHLVSGVTQRCLGAIANTLTSGTPTGSVVVACAEGDWHSLPAQMLTEVLRSRGFAVAFLGASTPSAHVARLLARDRPDALLISCNLAPFLAGVTTLADAAHAAGTPVIAGGRALGSGPERALRLGADAWAPDVAAAAATLGSWAGGRPRPSPDPTPFDGVAMILDLDSPNLASAALESMIASQPWMSGYTTEQLARTREDLAFIVQFIAAARLVDDPSVLMEFLDWHNSVLGARRVPAAALFAALEALTPLVDQADPKAGLLIRDALRHVSEQRQEHKTSTKRDR